LSFNKDVKTIQQAVLRPLKIHIQLINLDSYLKPHIKINSSLAWWCTSIIPATQRILSLINVRKMLSQRGRDTEREEREEERGKGGKEEGKGRGKGRVQMVLGSIPPKKGTQNKFKLNNCKN
jgi:hypothetical protein